MLCNFIMLRKSEKTKAVRPTTGTRAKHPNSSFFPQTVYCWGSLCPFICLPSGCWGLALLMFLFPCLPLFPSLAGGGRLSGASLHLSLFISLPICVTLQGFCCLVTSCPPLVSQIWSPDCLPIAFHGSHLSPRISLPIVSRCLPFVTPLFPSCLSDVVSYLSPSCFGFVLEMWPSN